MEKSVENIKRVLGGDIDLSLSPEEERYALLKFVKEFSTVKKTKEELSTQIDTFLNFGKQVSEENSLFAVRAVQMALQVGLKSERGRILRLHSWKEWSKRYDHVPLALLPNIPFDYAGID